MENRLFPYSISKITTRRSMSLFMVFMLLVLWASSIYVVVTKYNDVARSIPKNASNITIMYTFINLNIFMVLYLSIGNLLSSIMLLLCVEFVWEAVNEITKNLSDYDEYEKISKGTNRILVSMMIITVLMVIIIIFFTRL